MCQPACDWEIKICTYELMLPPLVPVPVRPGDNAPQPQRPAFVLDRRFRRPVASTLTTAHRAWQLLPWRQSSTDHRGHQCRCQLHRRACFESTTGLRPRQLGYPKVRAARLCRSRPRATDIRTRCEQVGGLGGAARGTRTPDPRITNAMLYRLSYCGNDDTRGRRGPRYRCERS